MDVATLSGVHPGKSRWTRRDLRPLFTDTTSRAFSYGSLVFRNDFIERHPSTTRAFVEGVARAIRWAQTRPREEVVDRFVSRSSNAAAATRTPRPSSTGRATASQAPAG